MLRLGARPEMCIFANPIKQDSELLYAQEKDIKKMTFDSEEELYRIKENFPKADCVLRIATSVTTAVYNLNEKFGVPMQEVEGLLRLGKKLGLRMKGVAFHCGSGGVTFQAYSDSIKNARKVFDMAQGLGLKEMDFLDIGGGFTLLQPIGNGKNIDEVGSKINSLINELFPDTKVQVIAEPGRYISEAVQYLCSRIIGSKTMKDGHKHYYLNNGIY